MGDLGKKFNRLLNGVTAICLALMSIFVFSNVILRYFFNSGLTWAEEASRYLFIWLIFLGAIVAFRENAHLGVDTLIQKLSAKGKKIVFVINNVLILITMGLVVSGTWELTMVTMGQRSPSMDIPLCFVYGSGWISSLCIAGFSLHNIYKLIMNKIDVNDLVMSTDSEDDAKIEQVVGGTAEGDEK